MFSTIKYSPCRHYHHEMEKEDAYFAKREKELMEREKVLQFLASWMTRQCHIEKGKAQNYTHFILECCRQIHDEEVLVKMVYYELKRHSNVSGVSPVSRDDIRTLIRLYKHSLHVPVLAEGWEEGGSICH